MTQQFLTHKHFKIKVLFLILRLPMTMNGLLQALKMVSFNSINTIMGAMPSNKPYNIMDKILNSHPPHVILAKMGQH